jgi:uncharacterized protein YfkK (UPF0435 family)
MACEVQVESNLRDEVYEKARKGLGMNIRNADQLAKSINLEYGHNVVSYTLTEDVIEVNIYIPPKMIQDYFENEVRIEIKEAQLLQEKAKLELKREAEELQRIDAARAGQEYTDRYLFEEDEIVLSETLLKTQRDLQIAQTLSDKFKAAFGIESSIISRPEAEIMLKNSPTPLQPTTSAFFFADQVYFIEGSFNAQNVMHEFSHPLIRGIEYQNPKLFANLYNQLASSKSAEKVFQILKVEYPNLKQNTPEYIREALVTAMELDATQKLNNIKSDDNLFTKFIKNLLYAIKQVLKKLSGKVKLAKLDTTTTLDELVDMMLNKDFVIEDLQYQRDLLAEFKNETQQYQKDLANVSAEKLQESIDLVHDQMQYQLDLIEKSPKKLKKILKEEGADKIIKNTRDYVASFTSSKIDNLGQDEAKDITDGLRSQEADLRIRSLALINSINEIETFSSKITDMLFELEKENRHLTVDGIAKIQYYRSLLENEATFIKDIKFKVKKNRRNPFIVKLDDITASINDNLDLITKLSGEFVGQYFIENTEFMSENIRKKLTDRLTEVLKKNDYSKDEIEQFIDDLFYKMDVEKRKNFSQSELKLPKTVDSTGMTVIKEAVDEYQAKKITRDTIEDYIAGKTEDLSFISGYMTPLGNVDDFLGGVFRKLRSELSMTENASYAEYQEISQRLLPFFEDAGIDPSDTVAMADMLLTVDKVPVVDSENNEISEYEIYTFIDKFTGWRYDLELLKNNLRIAHESGEEAAIIKATEELNNFQETYMERPFVDEVYDVRKIWNQENVVYDPSTKKDIVVSREVSQKAFVERQKALQELNVLTTNEAWTDLDDLLQFTPRQQAKENYASLYNPVDNNGKYKTGEELQKVLVRLLYKEKSNKFYEFSTDYDKFNSDLKHFVDQTLAGEGITPEQQRDKFIEQVETFLKKNLKIAYESSYWQEQRRILDRIQELQAKTKDEPIVEKLQELYQERYRIVNLVTDKDGLPNGQQLTSLSTERLKQIEEEITLLNKQFSRKSGLTDTQARTLDMYDNMILQGRQLTDAEEKEYIEISSLRKLKGLNTLEINELNNLFGELGALTVTSPTEHYIAAFNNALQGTGILPVTEDTVDEFIRDDDSLNYIFNQTQNGMLFEQWFLANHYVKAQFDESVGMKVNRYKRLSVWDVKRPADEKYYKKTTIIDPITGKEKKVLGIPGAKYTESTIKDEYLTIPRDKEQRKQYIGTIIDNRGNFLPKSKEKMSTVKTADPFKYINEQYYTLKSANDPTFKLLEAIKREYLKIQENKAYGSRMYLDLARFRQRTNLEVIKSGQAKERAERQLTGIKTALSALSAEFGKLRADDAETVFNYEESRLYIPTDLQGRRLSRVPVRGMYKLELKDTSTDIMRAMWDYMFSLNEQETLIENEPVYKSILQVLSSPENAIKDMNRASGTLAKASSKLKFLNKNIDRDKRIDVLTDYINRTFYGQRSSDFMQNRPGVTKLMRFVMGTAARAYFALNLQSSLKNRFGMQFNKTIEAAGGVGINARSLAQGKYRAGVATWKLGTRDYYAKGAKTLDNQIADIMDMVPGKTRKEFGKSTSRTLVSDFFDGAWMYSDRKLMEVNASMELGFGFMYHQMVDQVDENGNVNQIHYADAWELGSDGVIKLKKGIDPEWSYERIDHTVVEGDTLESLAEQYSTTVDKLIKRNNLKSERSLKEGENIIIGRATKFTDLKFKLADANNRLNGLHNQQNTPLAEKYLIYNTFLFSRRFLTGMILNRFQYDTAENNKFGNVYNWDTNELTRGYYIEALGAIKKTLTRAQYMQKYMTEEEKVALKKVLTEGIYLALLTIAISLVFAYDPGDEDRFKKIKARNETWPGWMANQVLYQLIMVRKENRLFVPIPFISGTALGGTQELLSFGESTFIGFGPTIGALMKISNDLYYIVTGNDKAYYKQDVGYYDWQKEGSLKIWNHLLGGTFGLTGKNMDPYWAIKKNEIFENLRGS